MRKKAPNWTVVVAGILIKNEKLLVGLRPNGRSLPGFWEFPGGKVEATEQPKAALQRELYEELNIHAQIGDLKLAITHPLESSSFFILFYKIQFWEGQPFPRHHKELKWVSADELKRLTLPQSNQKFLNDILFALKN